MLHRGFPSALIPGALSAALVMAPTFGGSADRAVAQSAQTRVVSCAGFDFDPIQSDTAYRWTGRVLYRASKEGDGWFMCAANLPHRAVVKQVRFTLLDDTNVVSVNYCGLIRTPLGLTGAIQALAMVPHTGLDAMPGTVRRSDTSIAFATVDNWNYAYSLQCQIELRPGTSINSAGGIIGAAVVYTISAANG